jgi:1,2-diacylglycerol 3-beta-galactosyltransferase
MKKKILYLFSDTGGGHRSAAMAIMKAVEELKGKSAPVQEMIDVFSECSKFLNVFARLYGPVIKYSPKMCGMLYYWLNDMKKLSAMEKLARPFIEKELANLLLKRKPDVIVSVHPMMNHLTVGAMRQIGKTIPMLTVVTDPVSLHAAWVCREVDEIIVATEEAKTKSIEYGAVPSKVKVIGLPIDPKFAKPSKNRTKARIGMDLDPKLFTVLLMGGGEGGGKMLDIVKQLSSSGMKMQLIVIAGRNEKLKLKIEKLSEKFKMPVKTYGFTNEVPEIMSASDLIITKAGPGSITEALARDLPIIITSWLPGQEEGNVEFVVKSGVGVVCADYKKIAKTVREMSQPVSYLRIKKNIKKVNNPKAVFQIAKEILNYL